jgi:hypothetical protein
MARETNFREGELDSLRVLGVLYARAGEYLEAEIRLHECVDLAHKHNDPYRHGQALLELGRTYQHLASVDAPAQTEYKAQAVTTLTEAARKFEALGAAYDLQLAQAALDQIQTKTTE